MNEQSKALIEKWITDQQSIDFIESASLIPVVKNDDIGLNVSELKLTLSSGESISVFFNSLVVTKSFRKLEDTRLYYLRKTDDSLYLERKADGWKYHLSKLGEEKYQALKDYYTHDEWETYTSLSIDSCIEFLENDILDHEKCFEACINELRDIKQLYALK